MLKDIIDNHRFDARACLVYILHNAQADTVSVFDEKWSNVTSHL